MNANPFKPPVILDGVLAFLNCVNRLFTVGITACAVYLKQTNGSVEMKKLLSVTLFMLWKMEGSNLITKRKYYVHAYIYIYYLSKHKVKVLHFNSTSEKTIVFHPVSLKEYKSERADNWPATI